MQQDTFRTKKVSLGESAITIGELSIDQVEDLIFANNPQNLQVEGKAGSIVRRHMAPVVAASLRNAEEGNADWYAKDMGPNNWPTPKEGTSGWTEKKAAGSYQLVMGLYEEICKFSGLRTAVVGETKSEGEAPAA